MGHLGVGAYLGQSALPGSLSRVSLCVCGGAVRTGTVPGTWYLVPGTWYNPNRAVREILNNKTHNTTRAGGMGVVARGRQVAYGARPTCMESRKLMAAAACIMEVASAYVMAADMAAVW